MIVLSTIKRDQRNMLTLHLLRLRNIDSCYVTKESRIEKAIQFENRYFNWMSQISFKLPILNESKIINKENSTRVAEAAIAGLDEKD